MDDLGNIVYVVIAIGWFLWSAYRKSQQAKEQQAKPAPSADRHYDMEEEEDESPFKTLEDIILEQLEGKKEPKPRPVVVQPHRNQDTFLRNDLSQPHLNTDYEMSRSEMKGHRVDRTLKPLELVEDQTETVMERLVPNGFDLRQAVVLNAILDRPYK